VPTSSLGSATHLVTRFFGSIKPGPPPSADEQWAITRLGDGERALWRQMNNPDRRHGIIVAHRVVEQLGGAAIRPIIAAALLHDVGKIASGFRTPARVLATLFWAVVPHRRASDWVDGPRPLRRLAQYRLHPELGEQMLADAGADPITSSWAADHHAPEASWRVDASLGHVLKDCDDD
jgi:hypothetical protein